MRTFTHFTTNLRMKTQLDWATYILATGKKKSP